MHKAIYKLAIATALFGLLLFNPIGSMMGGLYFYILIAHAVLGLILAVLLLRIFYTHSIPEIFNPFRDGIKKWNGFKLFVYLLTAIISGIVLFIYHISWLTYLHGFIGLWAIFVGWKHKK